MTDKLLYDRAINSDIKGVCDLLEDLSIRNEFTSKGISNVLRRLISSGVLYGSDLELTLENRIIIIQKILSVPEIFKIMEPEDATDTFEIVTNFGPAMILKMLLDTSGFLDKVHKSKIIWSLEHHYTIDILSKDSNFHLLEKDSSGVLRVLLSYQYILDLIDSKMALHILQNTMTHPNADSIDVIFENNTLLDKIGEENIRAYVGWIGQIKDTNVIQKLLENSKFIKYLSQSDWNACYRCAKMHGNEKLFEPYYQEECVIF